MVSTNDTVELALVGTREGQQVIVTHHFRVTQTPITTAGMQDLIDSWQSVAQTTWLALHTVQYTLAKVRARHICGTVPLDATAEEVVNSVGTWAGDGTGPCPSWFAAVCRERTALSGKSRRGRFFIPLSVEGDFNVDALVSGTQTRLQTYVTALNGAYLAGGSAASTYRLVVHSRVLAQPGVQCQNSSTLVTALSLQGVLATQKSRRPRPA